MKMEKAVDRVLAVSRETVHDGPLRGAVVLDAPAVHRFARQVCESVVAAHEPGRRVVGDTDIGAGGRCPASHAKGPPHLRLLATVDHRGVVRSRASDIAAHRTVLVIVNAAVDDDLASIQHHFEAQGVTMSVATLVRRSDVAAVDDEHSLAVADDEVAAAVEPRDVNVPWTGAGAVADDAA